MMIKFSVWSEHFKCLIAEMSAICGVIQSEDFLQTVTLYKNNLDSYLHQSMSPFHIHLVGHCSMYPRICHWFLCFPAHHSVP